MSMSWLSLKSFCVSILSQQVVLSSPYLCVNKVFIRDLLRVSFRVSESCGLQVINYGPIQTVTCDGSLCSVRLR